MKQPKYIVYIYVGKNGDVGSALAKFRGKKPKEFKLLDKINKAVKEALWD